MSPSDFDDLSDYMAHQPLAKRDMNTDHWEGVASIFGCAALAASLLGSFFLPMAMLAFVLAAAGFAAATKVQKTLPQLACLGMIVVAGLWATICLVDPVLTAITAHLESVKQHLESAKPRAPMRQYVPSE